MATCRTMARTQAGGITHWEDQQAFADCVFGVVEQKPVKFFFLRRAATGILSDSSATERLVEETFNRRSRRPSCVRWRLGTCRWVLSNSRDSR